MAKKNRQSGNSGDEDAALWQFVVQTIRAYNPKNTFPEGGPLNGPAPEKSGVRAKTRKTGFVEQAHQPPVPVKNSLPRTPAGAGFDKSTAQKLKKGKLPIEARLDLHGMTQEEALSALRGFIRAADRAGKRTVLVITGKGRIGGGVLKRQLPRWLQEEDFGRYVLAAVPASAKDGGEGAFYLRLRKKR